MRVGSAQNSVPLDQSVISALLSSLDKEQRSQALECLIDTQHFGDRAGLASMARHEVAVPKLQGTPRAGFASVRIPQAVPVLP